jgi:tetratricopeptide (TPR) repeat protein
MTAEGSGLVEIVREFLVAHRLLRQVAARYRGGLLAFDEVGELVGDDERSVLFRLKERTHALFRGEGVIGPAALFDLAVGSLFHEAMKFRENFYQRSAYGPKVQALRQAAVRDASGLLPEFEKLLEGAALRIDESLQELDTLLAQTTAQFRVLREANLDEGVLARVLVARGGELAEVFGGSPDELFAALYGHAASAWSRAGRSFLESGFYEEAVHAFERAAQDGGNDGSLQAYARGMRAYLAASYEEAALELITWLDGSADPLPEAERDLARAAGAALARVGALAGAESDAAVQAELALERVRSAERSEARRNGGGR